MNNSASDRQISLSDQQQQQQQSQATTSSDNTLTTASSLGTGLTHLVNRVDNILQSNTFLRSDLGNLISNSNNNNDNPLVQQQQPNQMIRSHTHSHINNNENTNLPNNLEQIVLNLQNNNTNTNSNPVNNDEQQQENGSALQQQQQPNNTTPPEQQPNFFLFLIQALQSSLPFFVILVAKIFHQHLLGFFIVLGFVTTLHWSNKTLVRQVELKDKKDNLKLILLILFLILNVAVFFFIFKEYKLYNCLIFLSPTVPKMDTWNLIWIVVCSDTIIKFIVIILKAIVTLMPYSLVPLRKRGNYYSVVETFALFYRSLTPVYPWILFLMYTDPSVQSIQIQPFASDLNKSIDFVSNENKKNEIHGSTAFPIILCILYFICKMNQLYNRFIEVIQSFKDLFNDSVSKSLTILKIYA
jgi:hypothetical protein